jgi:hypothetical protein
MWKLGPKKKVQKKKKTKYNGQQQKKIWFTMNPIWCQMKKCSPSNGQNGKLMEWWLLVHSSPKGQWQNNNEFGFTSPPK